MADLELAHEYPRTDYPLPPAIQELTPKRLITRWAYCPWHSERSSKFLGPTKPDDSEDELWLFRCAANDKHLTHIFSAIPDPQHPKTKTQIAKWLEGQYARLREKESKHRAGQ